jgi:transposase
MRVIRVGLDVAKNVFQVHGVAADGSVTPQRRLRRQEVLLFFAHLPPCLLASRHAVPAITGRASSSNWVTISA